MTHLHKTAKATHYDEQAQYYDEICEKRSKPTNQLIESILKKHKVKSVLDLTCGTGSQVFWLERKGFEVTGADISAAMLKIARSKARLQEKRILFVEGDMRKLRVGQFDAVITIFNAVGHLSKSDFEKAMRNIWHNLNEQGLYIFDINNLNFLNKGQNITSLTIDWLEKVATTTVRKVQFSTIDKTGVLASYTSAIEQKGEHQPKIDRSTQTLQIYSAKQLREMLQRNGFKVLQQCGLDGSRLSDSRTERIVTIAKKVK